jgi:hypothetical protein
MNKPAPKKPNQTGRNVLLDALKEVEADRQTKHRQQVRSKKLNKWFGWTKKLPGGGKGIFAGVLIVLVVLIGDGIRRENQELSAQIASVRGRVMMMKGGVDPGVTVDTKTMLAEKDVIITGADGEGTIVFPDGSSILVEPNSRFEVRLLGFSRGEARDRSFVVQFGSAVARFGQRFGKSSRGTVSTPTAVAAVRGTAFRVVYDPGTQRRVPPQSFVAVVEGTVEFRGPTGTQQVIRGQVGSTNGAQMSPIQALTPQRMQSIDAQVAQLAALEKQPGFLEKLEKSLNNGLNPLLELFGLSPGGWGYAAMDGARRAATQQALRNLGTHLEGTASGEAPDFLTLTDMQELQLDPKERDKLLDTFGGRMLESYRKTGRNQYVIRARSRDKKHTLYELTPGNVQQIAE